MVWLGPSAPSPLSHVQVSGSRSRSTSGGLTVVGAGRVAQLLADVFADVLGREDLDAWPEGVDPRQQVDGEAVLVLAAGDGGEEVAVVGGGVDAEVAVVARLDAVGDIVEDAQSDLEPGPAAMPQALARWAWGSKSSGMAVRSSSRRGAWMRSRAKVRIALKVLRS